MQAESDQAKLASAAHAMRGKTECASHHIADVESVFVLHLCAHFGRLTHVIDAHAVQCSAAIEDSVGEWLSFFEGSIVQFHLFEYEMTREFVRGESWGHEPRPNPYSALFLFFSM